LPAGAAGAAVEDEALAGTASSVDAVPASAVPSTVTASAAAAAAATPAAATQRNVLVSTERAHPSSLEAEMHLMWCPHSLAGVVLWPEAKCPQLSAESVARGMLSRAEGGDYGYGDSDD